ncbi:DUF4352 domain-containing protein [Haloarcula marina]|uniref:DUF4352 domain-containing protein n=1 Tax=Haloarcula marina TaxID=2961574 RepID=UPI0020B6E326|nr:DUF4352 domain-containing protein [Halomicroarcula marina]
MSTDTPRETDSTAEEETSTATEEGTETATQESEPATAEAIIGEVVEGERLSMVVRNVSRTTEIGEFQQADPGNTFVVIRLAVKNTTSDRFADFSGFLQTTLSDNEDFNYDPTLAVTGSSFQNGQLAPGEVSRGDVVFEVPKESSGLRLLFDFEVFSFTNFEQVFIDLSQEDSPIDDLTQNLQVQIYGIGDAIEFQGTTTTVNGVEYSTQVGGEFGANAEDGNTFAIIDISVTNETGEEQSVSTLLQMGAKDDQGFNYSQSLSATSQLDRDFSQGSPIPDGESRRGRIAYEVPQSGKLYWTFEFSVFADGDKTFWQLR